MLKPARNLKSAARSSPAAVRLAMMTVGLALLVAGVAAAAVPLAGLPANFAQVNNDPAAGIDPTQDAGLSDLAGGSLAGAARLPWATFEQKSGSAQLIFVRAFKNGAWVTQGAALNINRTVEAEAPSIDFAGSHRTVPWDSWYEPNAALGGTKQIFASRFNAAASTWVPEGQDRGSGVPSLNINTDKEAENPAVAGGAAVPGNDPVPWVAWQEQDGNVGASGNHDQIFVSKGVKQAAAGAPCTGFKPSANPSVSLFCWQQVGLDRLAKNGGSSTTGDPTLNIDPSRNGIEPDDAFTGPSDKVLWVVWYEIGPSGLGLRGNEQVFAAKIVGPDAAADGGFHWQAVGNGTAGQTNILDTSGANGFGACSASTAAEDACSLNSTPTRDAEDPSVAAGTLTPGQATVPWVVWAEDTGTGRHAIFISRLVGGSHFELFNGGRPLSNTGHDATHPDITFFGNVPYVSWIEGVGPSKVGFVGHFNGTTFVVDTPGGIRLPTGGPLSLIDFRVPISSSCTADPFTGDGSTCPGGVPDSPFELFTRAGSPQALFAAAEPCAVIIDCKATISVRNGKGQVGGTLGVSDPVGILVQRIVSQRRVHGRTVRRLKTVGKVPFGLQRRGRLRVRWNLRVNRHRLGPGRYLITLRAFDRHKVLIATAKPVVVVIR